MSREYHVKLEAFEGPLDLLLHLINRLEIDIYDIPVAEITEQYNEYIKAMQELELNVASEYLVMAATLIALKSQMLLPTQDMEEPDEYSEDPRQELTERLIEYRKYKDAAHQLQEKEGEEKPLFPRGPINLDHLGADSKMVQSDLSVDDMLQALKKVFERKKWNEPLETKVTRVEIPLEVRMDDIINKVKVMKKGPSFDQLFTYESRSHIVITFLATFRVD